MRTVPPRRSSEKGTLVTSPTTPETHSESRKQEQLDFLSKYWNCLMEGDMESFAPLVGENCVVHYPGNHFLSGDHVGRAAIVQLYSNLYKLGIEQGTFIGELHDATTSDDHACALVKYRIVVGKGMEIPGEAIGVFHIENGQMVEYWLLERDQKMINDIVKLSGKASLAGGSNVQMALGALKQPAPLARTIRRVIRVKRGNAKKML
jgi:ketosteroid isomerase-like protein